MTVFWGVVSCSLVEIYRRFRSYFCLHYQVNVDKSSKNLWNVVKRLPHSTAQHPRRQSYSYSPAVRTWNLTFTIIVLYFTKNMYQKKYTLEFRTSKENKYKNYCTQAKQNISAQDVHLTTTRCPFTKQCVCQEMFRLVVDFTTHTSTIYIQCELLLAV
jgi:hypothetical protein